MCITVFHGVYSVFHGVYSVFHCVNQSNLRNQHTIPIQEQVSTNYEQQNHLRHLCSTLIHEQRYNLSEILPGFFSEMDQVRQNRHDSKESWVKW